VSRERNAWSAKASTTAALTVEDEFNISSPDSLLYHPVGMDVRVHGYPEAGCAIVCDPG
jgi:hypothetical protein